MPARRSHPRQVNVFQAFALLLSFLLVAGIGGVLSAGLAMPLVAGASAATQGGVQFFDDLPTELEREPLSEQSRVRDSQGSILATFFHQNRIVVPLSAMSPHLQAAVIATEDRRFYEHNGIDAEGIARAFVNNLSDRPTQGGSTLTQQYVKNVLIQAAVVADDEEGVAAAQADTNARKLREAKLAIALEKRMSKDEILEGYLNIAQFGASVYGAEAAARHYFGVSAAELNVVQAATLAGITQNPGRWDPERNPEASEGRRNVVLGLMRAQGVITPAEYQTARDTPLVETLNITGNQLGCATAGDSAYFCDYAYRVIMNDPVFGETWEDRYNLLYRGGLDIYTTIDPAMQAAAVAEVNATIPVDDPSGLATALVTVEPGTGKVLAMAQNRRFNPRENPGPGETAVNYNADFDYGGSRGFQIGSTYKPFTLAAWLRDGKSLNQLITADRVNRPMNAFTACGSPYNAPGTYRPQNADGRAGGSISVLRATAASVNTAYVSMSAALDLCDIRDTAQAAGLHRADNEELAVVPSMTLGVDVISPLTLASSYATFAAGGVYCEPIAITRVVDSDGDELDVPSASCRQTLEPEVAAGVTHAMQAVVAPGGSASGRGVSGRPTAGKTGTSQQNWHAWFAGFTAQLSTVVWIGNANANQPMQNIRVNGQFYSRVYGGTIPAPAWSRYMNTVSAGMPVVGFPEVTEKILYGDRITVPDVVGRSPEDAAAALEAAGFRSQVAPEPVFHPTIPAGAVAATSPEAGARIYGGAVITLVVSQGPEPEPEPDDDDDDDRRGGGGRGPGSGPGGPPGGRGD